MGIACTELAHVKVQHRHGAFCAPVNLATHEVLVGCPCTKAAFSALSSLDHHTSFPERVMPPPPRLRMRIRSPGHSTRSWYLGAPQWSECASATASEAPSRPQIARGRWKGRSQKPARPAPASTPTLNPRWVRQGCPPALCASHRHEGTHWHGPRSKLASAVAGVRRTPTRAQMAAEGALSPHQPVQEWWDEHPCCQRLRSQR